MSKRGNPEIYKAKIEAYLNKQFRFSDGIMSVREKIDKMIAEGANDLSFCSVGSYKRMGERFDNKPTWGFYGENSGFNVGKIGANYINEKLNLGIDVDAVEAAGILKWQKENKPTTPGLHAGYMGR